MARVVYDALLQGKRIRARYASRSADGKKRADIESNLHTAPIVRTATVP